MAVMYVCDGVIGLTFNFVVFENIDTCFFFLITFFFVLNILVTNYFENLIRNFFG